MSILITRPLVVSDVAACSPTSRRWGRCLLPNAARSPAMSDPNVAAAEAVSIDATGIATHSALDVSDIAMRGHWSSPLCACCDDCAVCCSVWCCPWLAVSQLAQRYSPEVPLPQGHLKVHKCKVVAGVLLALLGLSCVFAFCAGEGDGTLLESDTKPASMAPAHTATRHVSTSLWAGWAGAHASLHRAGGGGGEYAALSWMLVLAAALGMCMLLIGIRGKIRRTERIPSSCCDPECNDDCCDNCCDDCCCVWWCFPCETCRLMRHALATAHGVTRVNGHPVQPAVYEFCSEEGTSVIAAGNHAADPGAYSVGNNEVVGSRPHIVPVVSVPARCVDTI